MNIVIVGHGPSIVGKQLGPWLDNQTVVRLKRAEIPNQIDWGSRTDYVCATSLIYQTDKPFWLFSKKDGIGKKWREYYAKFSAVKPSTGLGAIFCAVEYLKPDTIGLAGFDNLLYPDEPGWSKWWIPRNHGLWIHDSKAEHEAAMSLGVKVVDVTCQSFLNTTRSPVSERIPTTTT